MESLVLLQRDIAIIGDDKTILDNMCKNEKINTVVFRLLLFNDFIFNNKSIHELVVTLDALMADGMAGATKIADEKLGWACLLARQSFEVLFCNNKSSTEELIANLALRLPRMIGFATQGDRSKLINRKPIFILSPQRQDTFDTLENSKHNTLKYSDYIDFAGIKLQTTKESIRTYIRNNFKIHGFGETMKADQTNKMMIERDLLEWTNKAKSLILNAGITNVDDHIDVLSLLYFCGSGETVFDPTTLPENMKNWRNMYFNLQFIRSIVETLQSYYEIIRTKYHSAGLYDEEETDKIRDIQAVMTLKTDFEKRYNEILPETFSPDDEKKERAKQRMDSLRTEIIKFIVTKSGEMANMDEIKGQHLENKFKNLIKDVYDAKTIPNMLEFVDHLTDLMDLNVNKFARELAGHHYETIVAPLLSKYINEYLPQFQKMYLNEVTQKEIKFNLLILFEMMWNLENHLHENNQAQNKILSNKISQMKDLLLKASVSKEQVSEYYKSVWKKITFAGGEKNHTYIKAMDNKVQQFLTTINIIDANRKGVLAQNNGIEENEMFANMFPSDTMFLENSNDDAFTISLQEWNRFILANISKIYQLESNHYLSTNTCIETAYLMYAMLRFSNAGADVFEALKELLVKNVFGSENVLVQRVMDYLLSINSNTLDAHQNIWFSIRDATEANWVSKNISKKWGLEDVTIREIVTSKPPRLFNWSSLATVIPIRSNVNGEDLKATFIDWLFIKSESSNQREINIAKQVVNKYRTIEDRIIDIYEQKIANIDKDSAVNELNLVFVKHGNGVLGQSEDNRANFPEKFKIHVPIPPNLDIVRVETIIKKNGIVMEKLPTIDVKPEDTVVHYIFNSPGISRGSSSWETGTYICVSKFEDSRGSEIGEITSYRINVTVKTTCVRCKKDYLDTDARSEKNDSISSACFCSVDLMSVRQYIEAPQTNGLTKIEDIVKLSLQYCSDSEIIATENENRVLPKLVSIIAALRKARLRHNAINLYNIKMIREIKGILKTVDELLQRFHQFLYVLKQELPMMDKIVDYSLTMDDLYELHNTWTTRQIAFTEVFNFNDEERNRFKTLFPTPNENQAKKRKTEQCDWKVIPFSTIPSYFNDSAVGLYVNHVINVNGPHSITNNILQLPTFIHTNIKLDQMLKKLLGFKLEDDDDLLPIRSELAFAKRNLSKDGILFIGGDLPTNQNPMWERHKSNLIELNERFRILVEKNLKSFISNDFIPVNINNVNKLSSDMSSIVISYLKEYGIEV